MDKSSAKVYVDGANIFYAQKKAGWSLDWVKIKVIYLDGLKEQLKRS